MSFDPAAGAAMAGAGVIGLAGAVALGLVFLHAAISKLRHRDILPGVVANYRLLPAPLVGPVAAALPLVELVLGAALLSGVSRLVVLPAVLLMWIFAAAMAINIGRGRRHIDCGCGRSQLRQPLSWLLVWRNLGLTLVALPRLLPSAAPTALELATAISAGAGLFLITLLFNAIGALAASPLAVKRR